MPSREGLNGRLIVQNPTQLMLEPHKGVGRHFAGVMAKGEYLGTKESGAILSLFFSHARKAS